MRRNGNEKFRINFGNNLTIKYNVIYEKHGVKKMVSGHYATLSLLVPVAMTIGTSLAISQINNLTNC